MKRLVLAFVALLLAANAHAQTVINPHFIDFAVSSDHTATALDGSPILTRYELTAVAMNANGALIWTLDLGKPTPNATGVATAALPVLTGLITSDILYTAKIASLGPGCGGVGLPPCNVSLASNPFGIAGTRVPVAVANVKVR